MDENEITGSGGSSIEMWLSGGEDERAQVTLQRRVWEEIREETRLAGADLLVDVADWVAVLEGSVGDRLAKAAAERAAWRVKGLRGVENRIQVSSPIQSYFTPPGL